MFVSRYYIVRARIITGIPVFEGGVCVGEIASSRGLVEAHQHPVLQGLTGTTRVGVLEGVPPFLLLPGGRHFLNYYCRQVPPLFASAS